MRAAVFDQPSPSERGRAHGELWRAEIRELVQVVSRPSVQPELAALIAHAPALHEELVGIAQGADLAPEQILRLNAAAAAGSTAVYLCGPSGAVLGQSLDLQASMAPFVRAMVVRTPEGGGDCVCFTLTGCLGLAGLGAAGVAVTCNGLFTTDDGAGLVAGALVRALVAQPDARAAYELLRRTPLASALFVVIADGRDFFGVECSGELKVLTQVGAKAAHLHTNHCFDPVLRAREQVPRASSTFERLNTATTLYLQQRPRDLESLWALLASHAGRPRSICSHLDEVDGDPRAEKTCGRLAMEPLAGRVRVASGCSDGEVPLDLSLDRSV
jgi:isopenicillin-N N-acyltransferase-like protein